MLPDIRPGRTYRVTAAGRTYGRLYAQEARLLVAALLKDGVRVTVERLS